MLQTGLIGNTEKLEPFVNSLRKNKSFDIIGKASSGTPGALHDFHYSIPEINRVELIERADVLLIDDSLSRPFPILSDMVKKSKHIFMVGYLNLTTDECAQLVKFFGKRPNQRKALSNHSNATGYNRDQPKESSCCYIQVGTK